MATLSDNQITLFEELHNSRAEDFKTLNKKSYRGVWSGIIDKYPESAHFVYELLQNADDAGATEAHLILFSDRLLFKHNGSKHFDVSKDDAGIIGDINSITGIGDSSKISSQNKIGKFGVGFKAVFQYTDTPEIYDDYFKFKIENYIIPTLLTQDYPARTEGETLFVLPFKDAKKAHNEIEFKLENLCNPVLFLPHLQHISYELYKSDGTFNYKKAYSKELLNKTRCDNGDLFEHYRLSEPNNQIDILLFSRYVRILDKKLTFSAYEVKVGYYYDPKRKTLITNINPNIFCFFPTKETFRTCFISHAPFLLTDNRQNLKPGEDINQQFIDAIADVAAKALIYLRDYKIDAGIRLINKNIIDIIPYYKKNYYWQSLNCYFERPTKEAFDTLLSNERLLLSRNGKYLSLEEAYIGTPKELVELINQEQLVQLRATDYSNSQESRIFNRSNIDFLQWDLSQLIDKQQNEIYSKIKRYSSESFARDLSITFMEKQDQAWVIRMYSFIREHASKLWKLVSNSNNAINKLPFRSAPIIKTEKGTWVAPYKNGSVPNVFLPLKQGRNSNFNFIASEYLDNEIAMRFFDELELKEPDKLDYIRQVILKKFESQHISLTAEDLRADFEILLDYFKQTKDRPEDVKEYINLIKEKIYVCAKDGYLLKSNLCYFPIGMLKDYLSDYTDDKFLDDDFYSSIREKNGDIVDYFFEEIGVSKLPKVKLFNVRVSDLNDRIKKLLPIDDFYRHNISDYILEGFERFCDNISLNKEISIYLWNDVLPRLNLNKYASLEVEYRKKYKRTDQKITSTSTFKDALIHNEWIIDKNGNKVSPANTYLENLSPEYDQNNGLIEYLEIKRREKDIIELGGTAEQQKQFALGKQISQVSGNLTDDEIMRAIKEAADKKKATQSPSESLELSGANNTKLNYNDYGKGEYDLDKKQYRISSNYPYKEGNIVPNRKELRKIGREDMFVSNSCSDVQSTTINDEPTEQDEVDDILQNLIEQEEKHNRVKALRNSVACSEKYTKEWFEALIELEYHGYAEIVNKGSNKSINISFNSVRKEQETDRIYVFKNPSRSIPLWIEEIEDIEVKCTFSNLDDFTLKFEVANVRDNSLRLKASKINESILTKINWSLCTKATITLNDQIDLIGKLRTAFKRLHLEDSFNLKANLQNNIQFIFGPPGTGKTTTVAKKIISLMETAPICRILVLAPTNTACDELARKIIEQSQADCTWLYRFVSTADESLDYLVVDRESLVYTEPHSCIISTSARFSFDGFNGSNGYNRLTDIGWDMVICDEASMIPLAEMALVIYSFVDIPILIAGDPMQIKPILHEEGWKEENIYTMVNLDRFDNPMTEPKQFTIENLRTQYRSVPAIGELFSQYAYDGKLTHYRPASSKDLHCGNLILKSINFIPFKVDRFDSIFGVKKLDGSNVHIYSALLTVEMIKYIVEKYEGNPETEFRIGVVCPYAPQAQLIESLIEQLSIIPSYIKIVVGTVHRFQGGQCTLMFVVLNPPLGLKVASNRIFLNNKNILNVAISRAQDYLCILLPHRDTEGYENLYEINTIGSLAMERIDEVATYTCDQIESFIFGTKFFIENNTFVTSHQLTNVYSKALKRYEIHIDEKSVDIQLASTNE